jgi:4-hydroxythreonine-4-phosphate dehydrogenase
MNNPTFIHGKPVVVLTMGDVNGIGPEIVAKALAHPIVHEWCVPVVIGSPKALDEARQFADGCPEVRELDAWEALESEKPGAVAWVDPAGETDPPIERGRPSAESGHCAVRWIEHAAELCKTGKAAALVTAPISKLGVRLAGHEDLGHTELLMKATGALDVRMCLFSDRMRVIHLTGHMPLAEALRRVNRQRVAESVRIGAQVIDALGTRQKRIAVAGLNPHAGEEGLIGHAEADEIAPAVTDCREEGIEVSGPYPPDSIFRRMYDGEFDLTIALYHDQGHIAFKMIQMDEGVSATLGLPIVRTSVDHGTAYNIAWRGEAREASLVEAVRVALGFAHCGIHRLAWAGSP